MQEEIFGPVCSISKFKNKEDAIAVGNKTTYGLAAAVHTKNLNTAIEVSNALRAGTVWVNTYNTLHHQLPFGGYKESGIGRELGEDALANYVSCTTTSNNTSMVGIVLTICRRRKPRRSTSGWATRSSVKRVESTEGSRCGGVRPGWQTKKSWRECMPLWFVSFVYVCSRVLSMGNDVK